MHQIPAGLRQSGKLPAIQIVSIDILPRWGKSGKKILAFFGVSAAADKFHQKTHHRDAQVGLNRNL
jgi:hypothetical protein